MNRDLEMLKRFGPLLLAVWGWAGLALAVGKTPLAVVAAVAGLVASSLRSRSLVPSLAVEGGCLLLVIAYAPLDQLGFVALGAILVVASRALSQIFRAQA